MTKESLTNPKSYHHAIELNLSSEEHAKITELAQFLKEGNRIPYKNCAGSSSAILRACTEVRIPRILESSPLFSAGYLHLQKKLGNPKIGEIQYKGGAL